MPDNTIVTPIGASPEGKVSSGAPQPPSPKRSLQRDIDGLVCIVATLAALLTFALSAYFVYGFAQTDQGFWTLASAFGLCFGVGALAYVPLVIVALTAKQARDFRTSRKGFAFALLLMLPWICVSIIFTAWSALPLFYSLAALALSFGFSIWALARLRAQAKS